MAMKLTILKNGYEYVDEKGKPFKFKNKMQEKKYIEICECIWGVAPCDVSWAINTKIYNEKK